MAKRKLEEYTFANAYIGSFVRNLMSRQDLMRLASCRDLDAAESILQEFGYEEPKEVHEGNVEAFIDREKNRLFSLIFETIPERDELAMYLYPCDYHNVKVCLKAEFLGVTPADEMLMSTGDIDWKQLVAMVRDRNYTFMPLPMKHAVIEAADLFGRGGDPQEIDIILDKACYKQMLEAAEASEDDFLIGDVRLQIDIINLKTFVRLREINKSWSFFRKVFLEGGNIGESFFISGYEEPYGQLADKLDVYGFKEAMAEGGREIKDRGDFALFEKLCEDRLMEYSKTVKYDTFGIRPIAGYWHAREAELDNLRIILTGIQLGSSAEQIGERLREPYV